MTLPVPLSRGHYELEMPRTTASVDKVFVCSITVDGVEYTQTATLDVFGE